MKRSILYASIFTFVVLASGCTDDFTELNTDPKNLTVDNLGQSEYGSVVKAAMYSPVFMPFSARGPFQLTQSLFADVYANYFATTAPNFDSDKFILVGGWLNGAFNYFYGTAAPQIKYAEDYAAENDFALENAMMKVWRVWAYHQVTDYWGPIPYSQFGNRENSVAYDSQEEIYRDSSPPWTRPFPYYRATLDRLPFWVPTICSTAATWTSGFASPTRSNCVWLCG